MRPSFRILKLPIITESFLRLGKPKSSAEFLNTVLILFHSALLKCDAMMFSFFPYIQIFKAHHC